MARTGYLRDKVVMYLRNHTLMRRHAVAGGVFDFANLARAPRSIGFDISNALHVHLGDHLFLEPAMRACRDRGVEVVVAPGPAMREYFREAGYVVVPSDVVLEQELRVTSVWMYDSMPPSERRTRFLYVNMIDHGISRPVAEHMGEHVLRAARIDPHPAPIDGRPYLVARGATALDDADGRWLVFNDTVDSGWFRVTGRDRAELATVAAAQRRAGYRIVRVGTESERIARPASLGIEDLDLRGQTSVMDLFRLLRSPRVAGTVSFDHVVAHMGMACGKPAIVKVRRCSQRHGEFMKRYLIPPFAMDAPPVQYL
ncbi:MAG TPA: hypothetical protein VFI52_01270 [Gemmatimonadaceae bacterium]|nr:hypothetical protein [Gemmatimonadaceae bacterium]